MFSEGKVIIDLSYYSPRMRRLQRESLGCVNNDEKNTSSLKTLADTEISHKMNLSKSISSKEREEQERLI